MRSSQVVGHRAPYTVAVVEPNEVFRLGLLEMLRALDFVAGVVVPAEAEDPADALRANPADLVLASCSVESDVLDEIRRRAAECGSKLLLVVHSVDDPRLPELTQQSVDSLVLLDGLTTERLGGALLAVERGAEVGIPARLARKLIGRPPGPRRADSWHRNVLTQRETDVLQLLSQGLSNKQIAPRIGISEHGVKRHVGSILAKLNCSNRTEAVSYALQQNLLAAAPAAN